MDSLSLKTPLHRLLLIRRVCYKWVLGRIWEEPLIQPPLQEQIHHMETLSLLSVERHVIRVECGEKIRVIFLEILSQGNKVDPIKEH